MRILIIYQILFGVATDEVKYIQKRIIFLTIALMSIIYSANLCTNLMDIRIKYNQISLDSFDAIDQSGIELYVQEGIYDIIFNNEDQDLQKLKSKTYNVSRIEDCFDTLMKEKNVICVTSMTRAVLYAEYYKTSAGESIMKIAKPLFYAASWEYVFEKRLVFIEKLSIILLRMYEAGLNQVSFNLFYFKRYTKYNSK